MRNKKYQTNNRCLNKIIIMINSEENSNKSNTNLGLYVAYVWGKCLMSHDVTYKMEICIQKCKLCSTIFSFQIGPNSRWKDNLNFHLCFWCTIISRTMSQILCWRSIMCVIFCSLQMIKENKNCISNPYVFFFFWFQHSLIELVYTRYQQFKLNWINCHFNFCSILSGKINENKGHNDISSFRKKVQTQKSNMKLSELIHPSAFR